MGLMKSGKVCRPGWSTFPTISCHPGCRAAGRPGSPHTAHTKKIDRINGVSFFSMRGSLRSRSAFYERNRDDTRKRGVSSRKRPLDAVRDLRPLGRTKKNYRLETLWRSGISEEIFFSMSRLRSQTVSGCKPLSGPISANFRDDTNYGKDIVSMRVN
jgi:hypothetical protein